MDQFSTLEQQVSELSHIWKQIQFRKQELIDRSRKSSEFKLEEEHLERVIAEIEDMSIKVGEELDLDEKRKFLRAALKNKEKISRANQVLNSGDLENTITDALHWLGETKESLGTIIEATADALEITLTHLNEAQKEMSDLFRNLSFDESELEEVEERLFKIRGLSRKYNVSSDLLSEVVSKFKQELESRTNDEEYNKKLEHDLLEIEECYKKLSYQISVKRSEASKTLDKLVNDELRYLKMADCIFKTELNQGDAGPSGIDDVKFMVITNKGGDWNEVGKIASGGELSRFLLALKVCFTKKERGTLLIFDEIDRGIGGATADAVGKRLSALAKLDQILVVTHSPQVASHGSHHWLVSKHLNEANERCSIITELVYEDRLNEVARMLSGETVSEEARAAAKNLLS